jgi:hypothetical protein
LVENLRRIMIEREIAMCNAFLGTPESAIIKKYIEQNGIGVCYNFIMDSFDNLYSVESYCWVCLWCRKEALFHSSKILNYLRRLIVNHNLF